VFKGLRILCYLAFNLTTLAAFADTPENDNTFSQAVQAVKTHNYGDALDLFEPLAKAAKHDAQYNMAVLLQAGKGRPRNYSNALYWSWLAQLGGIEDAKEIARDMLNSLTDDDVKNVRSKVIKSLQARLDTGDIDAISQFANYHLFIIEEPDYGSAYIWFSIAAALNIPAMTELRDEAEDNIEAKDLGRLQAQANELFDKFKFTSFNPQVKGGTNDS
jgi:hypothetical protein